eukprot:TRINITY_DN937_c0_g1_i1.p1 TRINITY_DN937_c0_g1~~TRINITY_DN937_c0_g1_i1.p1  ORF type:complete len:195 (+),score=37.19 TRINITY_DN937_c0_g1_i1:110-694(+)
MRLLPVFAGGLVLMGLIGIGAYVMSSDENESDIDEDAKGENTERTTGRISRTGLSVVGSRRYRQISLGINDILVTNKGRNGFHFVSREALDAVIHLFKQSAEVILICTVGSDKEQKEVTDLLTSSPLVFEDNFDEEKLLFSGTHEGRKFMVRQLSPEIHIDGNLKVTDYLKNFRGGIIRQTEPFGPNFSLASVV